MTGLSIIPQPQSIEFGEGQFLLSADTAIIAKEEATPIAEFLAELLRPVTGFDFAIVENGEAGIQFVLKEGNESEAYRLQVTNSLITISSTTPHGLFHGLQTLRQLLPAEIENRTQLEDCQWAIPVLTIEDKPRFSWRGLHLDVGRHFYDVAFIEKFIDLMALYKFNVFHWHLTEDQGWRIEIKQYPKLTEIGSQRSETPIPANRHQGDGKAYGGFYTQDEIREIVNYAAKYYITIVPEIEMPGHAVAALASYPELGCVGKDYQVRTTWGIDEDVFCAGKDSVFSFLENVLTEVLELFPGEYIHIGGDECPKTRWKVCPDCQQRIKDEGLKDEHELQSYFIQRIEKWLNKRGRKLIGWDEILEGGLAPNATVMSWRGHQGGIDAANAGHDVVMSPTSHCYFDYYQSKDQKREPAAIGGYIPLELVYEFQPIPDDIDPEKAYHVLGGQANIWTEYMPTSQQVEYMTYPRAIALAEILWTYPTKRDFAGFKARLEQEIRRLEQLNVNYRALD